MGNKLGCVKLNKAKGGADDSTRDKTGNDSTIGKFTKESNKEREMLSDEPAWSILDIYFKLPRMAWLMDDKELWQSKLEQINWPITDLSRIPEDITCFMAFLDVLSPISSPHCSHLTSISDTLVWYATNYKGPTVNDEMNVWLNMLTHESGTLLTNNAVSPKSNSDLFLYITLLKASYMSHKNGNANLANDLLTRARAFASKFVI